MQCVSGYLAGYWLLEDVLNFDFKMESGLMERTLTLGDREMSGNIFGKDVSVSYAFAIG